jgi:hypothetical protein
MEDQAMRHVERKGRDWRRALKYKNEQKCTVGYSYAEVNPQV